MVDLFREINFDNEIKEDPSLKEYIQKIADEKSKTL